MAVEFFLIRRMIRVYTDDPRGERSWTEYEYLASQGGVCTNLLEDADPYLRHEADNTVGHWRSVNRQFLGDDCIQTVVVPMEMRH